MTRVLDQRIVRARIPHRCATCDKQIPAGRFYADLRLLFDGQALQMREHLRCTVIVQLAMADLASDDEVSGIHEARELIRYAGAPPFRATIAAARHLRRRIWDMDTRKLHPYPWSH